MDFVQAYEDYVVRYTQVFHVTDNGTVQIAAGGIQEINDFVGRFHSLFAVHGL